MKSVEEKVSMKKIVTKDKKNFVNSNPLTVLNVSMFCWVQQISSSRWVEVVIGYMLENSEKKVEKSQIFTENSYLVLLVN